MHYESSDVEKFSLAKNMSVVHCCGGYIRIFLVHMIFCRICWGHFLGMSHIFGDFRRSPDFLRSFSNKSLELLVIMVYPFKTPSQDHQGCQAVHNHGGEVPISWAHRTCSVLNLWGVYWGLPSGSQTWQWKIYLWGCTWVTLYSNMAMEIPHWVRWLPHLKCPFCSWISQPAMFGSPTTVYHHYIIIKPC